MKVSAYRNRLQVDTGARNGVRELLNGGNPFSWNGSALQFEIAFFRGDSLVTDLSNIDQVTLEVKRTPRTSVPLFSRTLNSPELNGALTIEGWSNGGEEDCHALIEFAADEANIDMQGEEAAELWLVISALRTDGQKVTLGGTSFSMEEDGAGVDAPPHVAAPIYLTMDQSDARYVQSLDLSSMQSAITALEAGKQDVLTGGASSIASADLTAGRALVSDGSGKVAVAAVTATELGYLAGVTGSIQAQLEAAGTAITGGASSIVSANLTANRALVSDGSGKVAVAAVTATELGYLSGLIGGVQGQISARQVVITGAATSITSVNLTASRALVSDGSGKVAVAAVTATELGYLAGVTGAIQVQLAARLPLTGGTLTGALTLPGAPTNALHAATKGYVDAFLPLTGGTLTGALTLPGAPTNALHAATKGYVDSFLPLTGGTLAGVLQFSGTTHAGLRVVNLTSAQITALGAVANGYVVYNTTLGRFQVREAGAWRDMIGGTAAGSGWLHDEGAPGGGLGVDGNYFINTADGAISYKTGGAWSPIVAGRLPLSGGTLTGLLTVAAGIDFSTWGAPWKLRADTSSLSAEFDWQPVLQLSHDGWVGAGAGFRVDGTQVVGPQGDDIANPGTSLESVGQCVAEILAALRAHGLIGPNP